MNGEQGVYDVDQITLQGKARVNLEGVKKGDRIITVTEGTFRAFEDAATAHGGDHVTGKARVGEAIVLSGEEYDEFRQRLADQRRVREHDVNPDQGQLDPSDPLAGEGDRLRAKKLPELRDIAKSMALSRAGSKEDLVQRIVDHGGAPA